MQGHEEPALPPHSTSHPERVHTIAGGSMHRWSQLTDMNRYSTVVL